MITGHALLVGQSGILILRVQSHAVKRGTSKLKEIVLMECYVIVRQMAANIGRYVSVTMERVYQLGRSGQRTRHVQNLAELV